MPTKKGRRAQCQAYTSCKPCALHRVTIDASAVGTSELPLLSSQSPRVAGQLKCELSLPLVLAQQNMTGTRSSGGRPRGQPSVSDRGSEYRGSLSQPAFFEPITSAASIPRRGINGHSLHCEEESRAGQSGSEA